MFKNSNGKSNSSNSSISSSASTVNSLGPGTYVEGTIKADTDIRIDGEVKGNLKCDGKLILGEKGKITGDVVCQNALIEGEIIGTVKVTELLHVKESAKIDGDISTDQLMVQPGAVFNVKCSMGNEGANSTTMYSGKYSSEVLMEEEEAA
jgi:cytoskeletal protein CcmA (bactofilin family)